MTQHATVAVQVWVDVDVGIVADVLALNAMPGVHTLASCQGTIGEGGAEPYGPYVMVTWDSEPARQLIEARYALEVEGEGWGHARPITAWNGVSS